MKQYLWNLIVSIDQFINVVMSPLLNMLLRPVSPFGSPDETLSSVFAKNRPNCQFCRWICRMLHRADPEHCDKSIEPDEGINKE